MAFWASAFEAISTNPKPRERPVSRSVMTDADSHVPTSANSASRSALVVSKDRFPTNSFFPMISLLLPPPGEHTNRVAIVRARSRRRERRSGVAHRQRTGVSYVESAVAASGPPGVPCGSDGTRWSDRGAALGAAARHAVPRSTARVLDEWPDRYRYPSRMP